MTLLHNTDCTDFKYKVGLNFFFFFLQFSLSQTHFMNTLFNIFYYKHLISAWRFPLPFDLTMHEKLSSKDYIREKAVSILFQFLEYLHSCSKRPTKGITAAAVYSIPEFKAFIQKLLPNKIPLFTTELIIIISTVG